MTDDQLDKTKTETNSLLKYMVENSETYNIYNEDHTKKYNQNNNNYTVIYFVVFLVLVGICIFFMPSIFNFVKNYIKN
ncbi:MAG: hypothetical protein ACRCXZ_09445 [Patescibacteria group bacterium]